MTSMPDLLHSPVDEQKDSLDNLDLMTVPWIPTRPRKGKRYTGKMRTREVVQVNIDDDDKGAGARWLPRSKYASEDSWEGWGLRSLRLVVDRHALDAW